MTNIYDQSARFAVKLDAAGFLGWLLPGLPGGFHFSRWLETQNTPYPGEPDRRCDTVAELIDAEGLRPPWALVVELQTRPDSGLPDRLLEYLARLRRELRHGPHGRDRYLMGAAVVYLTGSPAGPALDMTLPGQADVQLIWRGRRVAMEDEDAIAALTAIGENRVSRALLPWVPLMRGGGDAATVAEWKRLAGGETVEERRRILGGLAVIFADLAESGAVWRQALEDWHVELGPVMREYWDSAFTKGRDQGLAEGHRTALLRILQRRFPATPADLLDKVCAETSAEQLSRWLDAALAAATVEELQAAMRG
jgi:hypothetical protein